MGSTSAIPRSFLALAAALLTVTSGCRDQSVGTVTGTVTFDGQPVTDGTVVFQNNAAGVSVNAALAADGTYTARTFDKDGLPSGEYRVAITQRTFGNGESPFVRAPGPVKVKPSTLSIPEQYRRVETSGLSASVEPGRNPPFDFHLRSHQGTSR